MGEWTTSGSAPPKLLQRLADKRLCARVVRVTSRATFFCLKTCLRFDKKGKRTLRRACKLLKRRREEAGVKFFSRRDTKAIEEIQDLEAVIFRILNFDALTLKEVLRLRDFFSRLRSLR